MDRSAVKAIVDREIEGLKSLLGIEGWKIRVGYHAEDSDGDGHLRRGECTRMVDYGAAYITINPEAFEAESEVVETLRHELFHVVLAPFDLYWSAVERMDSDDRGDVRAVLSRVWDHSCERAVANLDKMFSRLSEPTMTDSRSPSGKRAAKETGPVTVTGPGKRPPSAETKPMAKTKAPAPKKDATPVQSTSGSKPMPVKKRGVKAKVHGKGS